MAENDDRKKQLKWTLIACGIILAIFIILSFPIVNFYGKWILLFAPTRPVSIEQYSGWVLGSHTLETEHGEIRLGHGSYVWAESMIIGLIKDENFISGRASHNLVVHGIKMPPNATIGFWDSPTRISILALKDQEIIISGIPVNVFNFDLEPKRSDGDIVIDGGGGHIPGTIITLADSAQILSGEQSSRSLHIYIADERWRMQDVFCSILVKLSGEEEFTRYRSITFRPDWGEFIEGELWEE